MVNLTGQERQGDGDAVKRRDRHHPGHDPGADEVGNRADRHGFQRVDFFVDPHGAQLRGDAGAEGGRQADSSDHRGRDSDVDESGQESGQRFDADIAQRAVALTASVPPAASVKNPTITSVPPIIAKVPAPMLISAMRRMISRR